VATYSAGRRTRSLLDRRLHRTAPTPITAISSPPADKYASLIKRYGLLEQDQEQQFARNWHEYRDRRATDALVTSHLRLAAKVARRYQRYGLSLADLISEANLGLVFAASRFEPDRGARFSTYALWWIKAAIHDFIQRSRSLVKMGRRSPSGSCLSASGR
jgi:RNA polymerase sigma-32 factor